MFNLYPQLKELIVWLYDVINCGIDYQGTAAVSGVILVALILSLVIIGLILNLIEKRIRMSFDITGIDITMKYYIPDARYYYSNIKESVF